MYKKIFNKNYKFFKFKSIIKSVTWYYLVGNFLFISVFLNHIQNKHIINDIEKHTQDIFIIENFFNEQNAQSIKNILDTKKSDFIHRKLPIRSASALSLNELQNTDIPSFFRDHLSLYKIQNNTQMKLQLVPRIDKNQLSALKYSEIGDGIDEHTDGNIYIGNRWAGIYIVRDDYNSDFFLNQKIYKLKQNSMLLFKADKIKHSVSRRTQKGERLVINFLLCDICSQKFDLFSIFYQYIINEWIFY
tara:strand:+ start:256 stop:993 length:738 start_codon:yes stop_codon:yes gene_type:complete